MFESRGDPIAEITARECTAEARKDGNAADNKIGAGKVHAANAFEICRHEEGKAAEGERVSRVAEDGPDVGEVRQQTGQAGSDACKGRGRCLLGRASRRIMESQCEKRQGYAGKTDSVKRGTPAEGVFECSAKKKSGGSPDRNRNIKNGEGTAALRARKIVGQQGWRDRGIGRLADSNPRSCDEKLDKVAG